MSDMVHYKGILEPVFKHYEETLEEQCKRLLEKEKNDYYDTYQEQLLDENYNEYIVNEGILYSVERKEIANDSDVFNAVKNDDGSINFEVLYYNGGCSFEEAIEYALENE